MSEPICTCTETERMTVCHDIRNEPHLAGCPRWGAPKMDDRGFFTYDEHGRRVTE